MFSSSLATAPKSYLAAQDILKFGESDQFPDVLSLSADLRKFLELISSSQYAQLKKLWKKDENQQPVSNRTTRILLNRMRL